DVLHQSRVRRARDGAPRRARRSRARGARGDRHRRGPPAGLPGASDGASAPRRARGQPPRRARRLQPRPLGRNDLHGRGRRGARGRHRADRVHLRGSRRHARVLARGSRRRHLPHEAPVGPGARLDRHDAAGDDSARPGQACTREERDRGM
ncbi:MAG: hypothetical protein AVDCRST_MAG45-1614, partial [uncultured Solirubrobacterales bacterium]